MCTFVILRRPGHPWPVLIAANRDEMSGRPWDSPGRHWSDRAHVTAGLDREAGGTWLGVNDDGLCAGVLNRLHTLGPKAGFRSRGELPLEALDHAEAGIAAEALSNLDPDAYRPFNMVIADAFEGYVLTSTGMEGDGIRVRKIDNGLSMITAHDLNDMTSPRMRHYLPKFRAAPVPDPDRDGGQGWAPWRELMASRESATANEPGGAMTFTGKNGFGTVSSSLIALPGHPDALSGARRRSQWLFAAGPPDSTPFFPVAGL
ncbi:MAG: NRDE family protein [Rhodospirillales bacterium]|nr:NRDE family protein [Rhodospirillales bacterium]